MRNEKNRPPMDQIGERQAREAIRTTQAKQDDVTTQSGPEQGFFAKILPKGAENGVKTGELLRMTGLSEARTIRRLISDERAAGAVILSGDTGYYLPDDGEKGRQEAAAFVASIKAKGKNTLRAARSAEDYLSRLPGQMEIGGGESAKEEIGK